MIEILDKDIEELDDEQLRELIGLLSEAEAKRRGISPVGITYGGDQNASDGGVDVRINYSSNFIEDEYIPCKKTIFQVKKSAMGKAEIKNEMRPNGKIRKSIQNLAKENGAYIIVSGTDSVSDTVLTQRISAMKEAVEDLDFNTELKLYFYDQKRIASWVRSHPSLILWVREKVGRSIQGWKPFSNWSNSPDGIDGQYLFDSEIRIYTDTNQDQNGVGVADGINQMRNKISQKRSSVRLIGLSGVGKTRLLQALFDKKIGDSPLNNSIVFYTDLSYNPSPHPIAFLEELMSLKQEFLLIVDNCSPELHRDLTAQCSSEENENKGSIITVEYDIREDLPYETNVFRLEPSSKGLIEKILLNRYKFIGEINLRKIAEFSGGNARIAIALADTIKEGEKIGVLRDDQLFRRLFDQRNSPDSGLLKTAQVCSLVYSFNFEFDEEPNLELTILSRLAKKDVRDIYEDVVNLRKRGLVQERHVWRAVLPNAIANRLANQALEKFPIQVILEIFENGGSERLLISFSRRLGYLHESNNAKSILKRWLSPSGKLSDLNNLSEVDRIILSNVAPIWPEFLLEAIENVANSDSGNIFTSRKNKSFLQVTRVLRLIAYDSNLFERSAKILCKYAISENPNENSNSIRDLLKSLFFLKYSGTKASANQRLTIIKSLVSTDSEDAQQLGLQLLNAALAIYSQGPSYGYDFGSRVRDYGYFPEKIDDIRSWFQLFLEYSISLVKEGTNVARETKKIISENFRALWNECHVMPELEIVAKEFSRESHWSEGWISVRNIICFDGKEMSKEDLTYLIKIESILRPTNILEEVRTFLFSENINSFMYHYDEEENIKIDDYSSVRETLRALGMKISQNMNLFLPQLQVIISELFCQFSEYANWFIYGLGLGSANSEQIWKLLFEEYKITDLKRYDLICDFLTGLNENDKAFANQILENLLNVGIVEPFFPAFQFSIDLDSRGLERLYLVLKNGKTNAKSFYKIINKENNINLSNSELCELLIQISDIPDGPWISIEAMKNRLIVDQTNISDEVKSLGKVLLSKIEFKKESRGNHGIDIDCIVELCIHESNSDEFVQSFYRKIAEALHDRKFHIEDSPKLLSNLALFHPKLFMDTFISENFEWNRMVPGNFRYYNFGRNVVNPISIISNDIIVGWCKENLSVRILIIASLINPFQKDSEKQGYKWTDLSLILLEEASDKIGLLNIFEGFFEIYSFSGSRSYEMRKRITLFAYLKNYQLKDVASWAIEQENKFEHRIHLMEQSEKERNLKDQRFEW